MIQIRAARMEDYEAICLLVRQVDAIHVAWHPEYFRLPDGPERERTFIQTWIEGQGTEILLALDSNGLVGVLMLMLETHHPMPILVPNQLHAVVDNLVVEEHNRGKGIGRALMEASLQWAEEKGATELRLQVYEKNKAAQQFYEELGFEPLSHTLRKSI